MKRIIRLTSTCVLLFYSYKETGWATTTLLALASARFELEPYFKSINRRRVFEKFEGEK